MRGIIISCLVMKHNNGYVIGLSVIFIVSIWKVFEKIVDLLTNTVAIRYPLSII